ncbi:MAG TPA: deoxyribonuclease V [Ktedonobacterales bacterium]
MHEWNVTPTEAVALQKELARRVNRSNGLPLDAIKTIAGVDASYKDQGFAVIVVMTFPELEEIERVTAARESVFPYVPGLLSFREAPIVLDAFARLRTRPDLLMCDGQGIAHPRRLGLASHLGVYLDIPSIGCAKSRLTGKYEEPGPRMGDRSPLMSRDETIGMVVRTKPRTNPLFVSIGNKIDLPTAVEIVLACLRGYRLPEPTRIADKLSRSLRSTDESAAEPPG